MRFTATSLIVVLACLVRGMPSTTSSSKLHRIPYGMAEFGPFHGENLSLAMPLSRNLTQLNRLLMSEKCLPFRSRCKMAEQCCSLKCLVHIRRCNA